MKRDADFEQVAAATRDEAHPTTYDPVERARLMNEWGIQLGVLYPNAAGVNLTRFLDFAGTLRTRSDEVHGDCNVKV